MFRCDPDGANLEVVMTGLRNPQELAFDQFGNLFADDNNCDKGDHARLVYVVEGGDAGWNMAYQTIPQPYLTGPWFAERLWHLPHAGQAAYVLPPVGRIGTGPSGFLFTSGTSLGERYKNSFLMCNFASVGGLESFRVTPKGAGFEVADYHTFLSHGTFTDAEFGYDGKLYASDFVGIDWNGGSKGGRIYTLFDAERLKSPVVQETKRLFAEGFKQRSLCELARLLGHADQRVRQRAQFALAGKGPSAVHVLTVAAGKPDDRLARLHAVWALGQLARRHPEAVPPVSALLQDKDDEVRGQAVKLVGDLGIAAEKDAVAARLSDASPRVRFFAVQTMGKLKARPAVRALSNPRREQGRRPVAAARVRRRTRTDRRRRRGRRAAERPQRVRPARGRARAAAARRPPHRRGPGRRRPARPHRGRPRRPRPADGRPVPGAGEAARQGGFPAGRLRPRPPGPARHQRLLSAGRRGAAQAVLDAAANPRLSLAARTEAVAALRDWAEPPPRDRVTGFWRPLPKRDPQTVARWSMPGSRSCSPARRARSRPPRSASSGR